MITQIGQSNAVQQEETPDRWQQVWGRIDERRQQLRMSLADLYRATGTSEGTFRKMRIEGIGVTRSSKRAATHRRTVVVLMGATIPHSLEHWSELVRGFH